VLDWLMCRYRQTVIRNIPQLQKLDNVAVTSEEMADAMRRGIDLDHPLDGGSDNQTAKLQVQGQRQEQVQGQRQEQQEDTRRISRNSNIEQQEYEQPQRKESIQVFISHHKQCCNVLGKSDVQSPSRRVSNQEWPEERVTMRSHPSHQVGMNSMHSTGVVISHNRATNLHPHCITHNGMMMGMRMHGQSTHRDTVVTMRQYTALI